jgi:hypothetical protein
MLLAALLALASFALAQQKTPPPGQGDQDKLVEIVRHATTQYVDDVKAATGAGYSPALGFLSGSDHGAMGIHYVNGSLVESPNAAPRVEGQLMLYVDSPNRYGLPAFFELHVWAWRDNPRGPFVDWNDHVSCACQ